MTKAARDSSPTAKAEGKTPTTPPELLAAPGYIVRRLHQAYLAAWVRTVDATLTGAQFAVLTAISRYPGVDQGSLAASVALDRSTMADLARRLESRGLIARETPLHDGRRKLLYLTDEGADVLDEVYNRARELDDRLLEGHSTKERQRIVAELTKLAEQWETIAPLS